MKTMLTFAWTLCTVLWSTLCAQNFEGRTVTKIEVADAPPEMQSMKSMVETTMTTWIKGSRSRMESTSPFMGQTITITDFDKKEIVTCMNMMGQKMAVVSHMDEQAGPATMPTNVHYKETGNTKTILGYTCHEGIGTYTTQDGKTASMSMWYCKDIPNRNSQYPSLSGMPMEYSMLMQGMTMKVLTVEIHKESVSEESFKIPDGYTLTTQEEMRKSMGGKK